MIPWPRLISKLFVAYIPIYNAASSWPRTVFTPRVFLFSISLLFVNINKCYSTLLVDYSHSIDHKQMICLKFQIHKPYWCMNVQWKFKEIVTWNFLKITFIMYLLNTFKCLLLAESCFTGRAYIGELLMQIWLKSIKK